MWIQICKQDRTGEEQDEFLEVNRCMQTEPRETAHVLRYYLNIEITKRDAIKRVMLYLIFVQ